MTLLDLFWCVFIGIMAYAIMEVICGGIAWLLAVATAFTSRTILGMIVKLVLIVVLVITLPIIGMFTVYPWLIQAILHIDLWAVINTKIV